MIDFNTHEPYIDVGDGYKKDNSIVTEDEVPGRSFSVKYNVFRETNKIVIAIKRTENSVRIGKYFDIEHDLDKLEENIQYYIDKWYEDEPSI